MAGVLVMRALVIAALLGGVSCSHVPAKAVCAIDRLPQADQGRVVEVSAALLASPTWIADLGGLADNIGMTKVDCLVAADVEALMQVANRSPSDSFVVEPHLAAAVARGREWLKAGPAHANVCAGK